MKKLFQILFFVLCPLIMYSQDSLALKTIDSATIKLKRHTLFFELGGTCIFYSIKYDCILKQWNRFSINSGIGFSILPVDNYRKINSYREFRLPMQLSGLYGKNKSKLEFGVSIIFISSGPTEYEKLYSDLNKTEYGYDTGINIGYCYQKKHGGLFFKAFVISFLLDDIFGYGANFNSYILDSNLPWIGIGIGHTFK